MRQSQSQPQPQSKSVTVTATVTVMVTITVTVTATTSHSHSQSESVTVLLTAVIIIIPILKSRIQIVKKKKKGRNVRGHSGSLSSVITLIWLTVTPPRVEALIYTKSSPALSFFHWITQLFVTCNKIFFWQIKDKSQLWRWLEDVWIPASFAGKWYNGQEETSTEYIGNKMSILVGMPRLRQLRVLKGAGVGNLLFTAYPTSNTMLCGEMMWSMI